MSLHFSHEYEYIESTLLIWCFDAVSCFARKNFCWRMENKFSLFSKNIKFVSELPRALLLTTARNERTFCLSRWKLTHENETAVIKLHGKLNGSFLPRESLESLILFRSQPWPCSAERHRGALLCNWEWYKLRKQFLWRLVWNIASFAFSLPDNSEVSVFVLFYSTLVNDSQWFILNRISG